ncbi:phosphohydrolase [Paeniglutamicibacter antarcticus]|uniref:Phosphohydrolase n=1 Tax=Arthrobacter terrae TaxID=2935737 RepID=A0A931CRW2_9MICC|nr:phosphohydrolase [Arthrobacter terrae]MBG0738518.1 phosphohydrolase [Arthrobacter terrae]
MTEAKFTVETAMVLAEVAHSRQKDKLKRPYGEHVMAVGDALADFDDDIRIAGYLHSVAEDTPMTRQGLLDMGVPPRSVEIVERVSTNLQEDPDDYLACIRAASQDHDAALVKISDNAHNSLPERVQALARKWPDKTPTTKYADAREILYRAVPEAEVLLILQRANPFLIPALEAIVAADNADAAAADTDDTDDAGASGTDDPDVDAGNSADTGDSTPAKS